MAARARAALEGPGLPEEIAYLWEWFRELDGARGSNGFGPMPVSYAELDAWARLTGRHTLPWEVRWLMLLDRIATSAPAKKVDAEAA